MTGPRKTCVCEYYCTPTIISEATIHRAEQIVEHTVSSCALFHSAEYRFIVRTVSFSRAHCFIEHAYCLFPLTTFFVVMIQSEGERTAWMNPSRPRNWSKVPGIRRKWTPSASLRSKWLNSLWDNKASNSIPHIFVKKYERLFKSANKILKWFQLIIWWFFGHSCPSIIKTLFVVFVNESNSRSQAQTGRGPWQMAPRCTNEMKGESGVKMNWNVKCVGNDACIKENNKLKVNLKVKKIKDFYIHMIWFALHTCLTLLRAWWCGNPGIRLLWTWWCGNLRKHGIAGQERLREEAMTKGPQTHMQMMHFDIVLVRRNFMKMDRNDDWVFSFEIPGSAWQIFDAWSHWDCAENKKYIERESDASGV